MNRCLAFLLAVMLATITVSSATVAAPLDWIGFTLNPERGTGGKIRASFNDETRGRDRHNWSTGFLASELVGLDAAGFLGSAPRPLRFSIIREAGQLDCSGNGSNRRANGTCRFTPDPAFTRLLEARGIGRPTRNQAFGLMAIDAKRELFDALAAARYPAPSTDDLFGLTALGVDRPYIAGLARAGYRPHKVSTLIEFKALGITPEWIGGFTRLGYGSIPPSDLVQLRALDVTPEFVAGFDRLGYGRLPAGTLVQLKALGITPEFARSASGGGSQGRLSVDDLVEAKLFGHRR